MAQITITVPDAWAAAVSDDLVAKATEVQTNIAIQKVLAAWGKTFEQTTKAEKIELFLIFCIWLERSSRLVGSASSDASESAAQDAIDEFSP